MNSSPGAADIAVVDTRKRNPIEFAAPPIRRSPAPGLAIIDLTRLTVWPSIVAGKLAAWTYGLPPRPGLNAICGSNRDRSEALDLGQQVIHPRGRAGGLWPIL